MSLIVLARQAQAINQIYSDLLGRHSSCPRAGAKLRNFCDSQGRLAQVERSWEAASERMRKWRANEKIERKWRENEKMEREKGKWRETLVSIVALRKTVKIRSLNEF